ncbi:MAG TPA: DUF4349 domain-containing protein [Candidatus Dormibacteraeota bacterium]|nr:DUF4349 domain-containing protein [Candidatus Dormibacteraeota bacterium]
MAAACGGGGGASTASSNNGGGAGPSLQQPVQKSSTGQGSATVPQPGDSSGGTTVPNNVPALAGPPVIRQATLSIGVGSGTFGSKLAEVRGIVEAQGGYIAGTDAQASSPTDSQPSQLRTGVISFMVPAANFDATIDQISKVGTLQGEHITGNDVSAQYVDLNARLANAEAQHQVYLALLAKATTTNDIIAIENQIGQITAQIEQLKGQIKYLDNNTSYSSITVTMTEAPAPAQQPSNDSWGFATALSNAAHNFVATINYVISGLGAVGPFLVLVAIGLLVWRRRRVPQPKHA